jgi:hypothetical protein
MAYLVGILLALAISGGATLLRMDRDRAFYSLLLMVVASYYALFAIMAGSTNALLAELAPIALFILAAAIGFKRTAWLIAAGLIGHGLFDSVHGRLLSNPGVPGWWPMFCGAYDVTAGVYLAAVLRCRRAG